MRPKYIILAAALGIGVTTIAWSADEPTPPASAPAAQAAPAAASSTSSAAEKAPAKDTANSKNSDADAAAEKHLLASGYKKKTVNGQTVYCRKEIPIGSRFEKEHCGTAQDMELQAQQARDLMNSSRMSQGSKSN